VSRVWLGAALAGLLVASAVSCDSSEGTSPKPGDDGGPDAARALEDADVPDADAAPDADASEPVRCSADGFCHTVLPPGQTLRGVWGDDHGVVWAVSEQGDILRWDGSSWEIRHSDAGALHAIWGSSPTDIWVGGDRGLLHGSGPSSKDLVWTSVTVPGAEDVPISAIAGRSASDIWAVGGSVDLMVFPPDIEGRILHFAGASSDPGAGWTIGHLAPDFTVLTRVWTTSQGALWIGGANHENAPFQQSRAVLLHQEAGSDTLSDVPLPMLERYGSPAEVETVTGGAVVAGELVVLGITASEGVYLRASDAPDGDASLVWEDTRFDVSPSHLLHAVWGSSDNDILLAGDYGRLRRWDGTTWSLPRIVVGKAPLTNTFHAVWASADDDLWFVGDRIALHKRPPQK